MLSKFRRLFVLIAIFSMAITAAGQTEEPRQAALERRGLYHATLEGRFVSPDGVGVGGVHVQLHGASLFVALPVADAVTGLDGRFIMRDVNSSYMPDLRWYPPPQWMQGGIAVAGESGSTINLGIIQLRPDTVVRLTVELVGGPTLDSNDRPPSVILDGKSEFGPRIPAQQAGPYRAVSQIPFEEGTWKIELFTKGRFERYEAPFRVEHGRRDQLLRFRLLRDSVKMEDRYSGKGALEVREETLPPAAPMDREFHARGRVLAPDGSPVSGAIVALNDIFNEVIPQWTTSSKDGSFDLRYSAVRCLEPAIFYAGRARTEPPNSREECEARWSRSQDLVMTEAARLTFQTEAVGDPLVRAYWWHDSVGWTEFSSPAPWISPNSYPSPVFKVEAPGFLALAQVSDFPAFRLLKKPPEVQMLFRYSSITSRTLTVRANGRPLSGAIVDVEKVEDLAKNRRIQLGSYTTSADGELRLAGGADQLVEVFVYANGYEPRRAIWQSGVPLTLDLIPRDATLSFGTQSSAVLARIRPIANPNAVRTASLKTATQMSLAPGEYDITTYNDRGTVLGYQRIRLAAAASKTIDPSVDQRPRLTLRFPATGWQSEVNESTPRGGAVNWQARIAVAGTLELNDVPATRIQSSPQGDVYLLSRAGRMQVRVQREDSPILWREISIQPGESLIVDVPAERATLEAPSNFDPGQGHTHGIAGPRIQLIADASSDWSITGFLPQKKGDVFRITGIPPGDYHLYHHLFNGKLTYQSDGETISYTGTPAAWGGVAVRLSAGKTTRVASLNTNLGDLSVRLSDPSGRPINNATLRIRDRMSDAWRQVEENPAQIEQAGLPIPYPTAVRILDGKARLPQIRSGWLEFAVESDAGAAYSYTMPVTLGQELRVTVPLNDLR